MGAKPSTPQSNGRPRSDTFPNHSNPGPSHISGDGSGLRALQRSHISPGPPSSSGVEPSTSGSRTRSTSRRGRSMSAVESPTSGSTSNPHAHHHQSGSDSDDSSADLGEDHPSYQTVFRMPGSLPLRLFQLAGLKCPVCGKQLTSDKVESHLVECLTKPRLIYNEDIVTESKGECIICFEEMSPGHTIARLPCLCVYHKRCIDSWFRVNRSCPEHPAD